ncbi:MAG TPA: hypothetical protein PKW33_21810 [Anaerolineaceae bacterium]|nr:hypothetical protein [Anaerolineaceae bacterium]HPN54246.1 hypothetical protein [Anaerolineaceae bacterium]
MLFLKIFAGGFITAGLLLVYLTVQGMPTAPAEAMSGEITVSERTSDEYGPVVAYNTNHNEYLVVWENIWPGGSHDIYAQRVSSTGQLLSWFAVSTSPNNKMAPSVSYDPIHDRYLIVWIYDVFGDGSDWDVYGRFIPWEGPDTGLADFPICTWTSNQAHPKTAFAYAQQEFLVVWMNAPSGQPTYISARRVFSDGSGFPAGGFLVSSGTASRDFPDVTYNLARNEYLVVWDVVEGAVDIHGMRLSGMGVALQGGDPYAVGEFAIAGWPDIEEKPKVAACDAADQYLVLWQSDIGTSGADYAIYERFISGAGVPGTVAQVANTTAKQLNADVACNFQGNKYLAAWQDQYAGGYFGIWARYVYPDGSMEAEFGIVQPGYQAHREYPAVSGGKTNFLVSWEHIRDGGNRDVHGRLMGYFLFMPFVTK